MSGGLLALERKEERKKGIHGVYLFAELACIGTFVFGLGSVVNGIGLVLVGIPVQCDHVMFFQLFLHLSNERVLC